MLSQTSWGEQKKAIGTGLVLCSLLFGLVGAAWADVPMAKLTIRVLNDSSRPIDRASVIVRFVEGRAYLKLGKKIRDTYELRTNQEGEVTLPEIPQGKILIQVIAHGYQTFGQTFDVHEEERTFEIKLLPPQKQYSAHENQ
jgi:Carboxypeptidase regulatory-like domain